MPLPPLQRYHHDLHQHGFVADAAQRAAVAKLQNLYDSLLAVQHHPGALLGRLFGRQGLRRQGLRRPAATRVQGLYLWGGVGRGKTYLMDNFYESLPFATKMRAHFHRFMRRVHRDMQLHAGHKNPLERVAAGIASETRVLCFDEFFVSDITDAMILGTLMEHLFARGVTLVASSTAGGGSERNCSAR